MKPGQVIVRFFIANYKGTDSEQVIARIVYDKNDNPLVIIPRVKEKVILSDILEENLEISYVLNTYIVDSVEYGYGLNNTVLVDIFVSPTEEDDDNWM